MNLREELRAVEWDIESLDQELERAVEKARRLRQELRAHTNASYEAAS